MVWGSMSWNGVGQLEFIDGIMNKELPIKILDENLRQSVRKLRMGRRFIFQQDGDPKHTAKIVTKWFNENKVKVLDWVGQSPDLNPIEHLWSHLKRRIAARKPSNLKDLKTIIVDEWNQIGPEVTQKLVESMPRRIQAVIEAKGGST